MKYQILNILFALLIVCIQLQSLTANDEANALKIDSKDINKLREYLKELNEYKNSLHEGNNDDDAAAVYGEQQQQQQDDEPSEATTSSMEDEDLAKRSAFLRFGKRSYLRFGRNPNLGFLRFGKRSQSSFLRFGKRQPAFLRFGRK